MNNDDNYLVIGTYYDSDKNKVALKLYNLTSNTIEHINDWTNYNPYLLTDDLSLDLLKGNSKVISQKEIIKINPFTFEKQKMYKISVKQPSYVPEIRNLLKTKWESRIPYHHNWIFDTSIIPGMIYKKEENKLIQVNSNNSNIEGFNNSYFEEKYQDLFSFYKQRITSKLPDFLITSFDIEVKSVEGRFPNPSNAIYPITCISIVSSLNNNSIYLLNKDNVPVSHPKIPEGYIKNFKTEKELLIAFFSEITTFPIIVTYNGNAFDLPYLLARAKKLNINTPIKKQSRLERYSFNKSVHIDLYEWYKNPAIKTYAFGYKYKLNDLNSVAKALTNIGKIKLKNEIQELSLEDLAFYCWNDSIITLNIAIFENQLPFKLITFLCRITSTSMEELTANFVSSWLRNLFYSEHRRMNYLIPNKSEINHKKSSKEITESITRNKKYKGALVIDPVPGIHFDVKVLDFASLYPSIISTRNLSYETINCVHKECKSNSVKGSPYYTCTKQSGLFSQIIGLLRDIRVKWLKPAVKKANTKEEISYYNVMEKSMKVLINASYGIIANEFFPFYCLSVADATTSVGRYAITLTINKCEELGIDVLYGDTDSVFLKSPTDNQIDSLINWSDANLDIKLDIDKEYIYCTFSERKKNYLGLLKDGSIDIKGLLGKKRNTPKFLQEAFKEMLIILQEIKIPQDFKTAKEKLKTIVNECYRNIENDKYSYEQLAITVQLNRNINEYESTPIHVRAAKMLVSAGIEVKAGQIIRYVKLSEDPGIMPIELIKNEKIDIKSYKSFIDSTFSQILESLDININQLKEKVNLLSFFS